MEIPKEVPKFDEKELEIVEELELPYGVPGLTPVYNFPVTCKQAGHMLYEKRPPWQVMTNMGVEFITFNPSCIPDNHARAMITDATATPETNLTGGTDMFGIEWEYVEVAQGSMVKPGKPFIEDASELNTKIVWPDPDSWDWEGCAKANEGFIPEDKFISTLIFNGWFERLISLMDFEGAIMALFDEEQKEDVKKFFDRLSDTYIRMLDNFMTYFPLMDSFCIHDDWGSQQSSFFSPEVAEEMIVPYMKKVVDFIHSKGRWADLHSCGCTINMLPNFIAAGWDSWAPQEMNDTGKMYEMYGDQIIIAVMPEEFDPETTPEEEQRRMAREYAEKYCNPDKPSALNMYSIASAKFTPMITRTFREELYRQSRIRYSS